MKNYKANYSALSGIADVEYNGQTVTINESPVDCWYFDKADDVDGSKPWYLCAKCGDWTYKFKVTCQLREFVTLKTTHDLRVLSIDAAPEMLLTSIIRLAAVIPTPEE